MSIQSVYETANSTREKPSLKLYQKDLSGLKDIDVDDVMYFHVKAKAISKYHEDYEATGPLCITFEVQKIEKCDEDCNE